MQSQLTIDRLTPVIGAEVSGVDFAEPLGDNLFKAIEEALMEHQVLFFRDQDMTLEQHKDVGRRFGELHIHPSARGPEGHPEILRVHADENTKRTAGDKWHSDVSCDPEPPSISILHLHTLPSSGGDTLFSGMYAAYDALSPQMQAYLGTLTAIHDGGPNYRDRSARMGYDDSHKTYPRSEHKVIRTHPVTGRKGIYVNSTFTTEICGVPADEGNAILAFLYNLIAKPQFQCRFRWEPKSVAMWDNRCVQHHAMWDYYPEVRSGNRVTVCGDAPY
ncbi:MAG: TauD/TfdA family dioxygenase [Gammaproteobacteria bacterium]|nr:TauD/TfdA family dioxygenase [Gammaproteobacteria bacterium]